MFPFVFSVQDCGFNDITLEKTIEGLGVGYTHDMKSTKLFERHNTIFIDIQKFSVGTAHLLQLRSSVLAPIPWLEYKHNMGKKDQLNVRKCRKNVQMLTFGLRFAIASSDE